MQMILLCTVSATICSGMPWYSGRCAVGLIVRWICHCHVARASHWKHVKHVFPSPRAGFTDTFSLKATLWFRKLPLVRGVQFGQVHLGRESVSNPTSDGSPRQRNFGKKSGPSATLNVTRDDSAAFKVKTWRATRIPWHRASSSEAGTLKRATPARRSKP